MVEKAGACTHKSNKDPSGLRLLKQRRESRHSGISTGRGQSGRRLQSRRCVKGSLGQADLFHVSRQIPIVGVSTDLSVGKVDNCRTANFKSLVGSREPREVLRLPPSPNPFYSARSSVSRDEPRFQLEFQICERAEGCRREVTKSVFSLVNGT